MKKPSTAVLGQALELKPVLERAAALTNRPDRASEIATAWVAGLTDGVSKEEIGTFALQCEDVVGILLAAYDATQGSLVLTSPPMLPHSPVPSRRPCRSLPALQPHAGARSRTPSPDQ